MIERDRVDQARRRLAVLLAGTPLSAALQAAPGAPVLSAPVPAPTDGNGNGGGGGDFTGRWVHAFAAYGAPKN